MAYPHRNKNSLDETVILSHTQMRDYLEGWLYNVGARGSLESTVETAFANDSVEEWFGARHVDYDFDKAVEILQELLKD